MKVEKVLVVTVDLNGVRRRHSYGPVLYVYLSVVNNKCKIFIA